MIANPVGERAYNVFIYEARRGVNHRPETLHEVSKPFIRVLPDVLELLLLSLLVFLRGKGLDKPPSKVSPAFEIGRAHV